MMDMMDVMGAAPSGPQASSHKPQAIGYFSHLSRSG